VEVKTSRYENFLIIIDEFDCENKLNHFFIIQRFQFFTVFE